MTDALPFAWEDYGTMDATALAERIDNGDASAKEVARQAQSALTRVNPSINAVIEIFEDAVASPEYGQGPFAGVPMLLKDLGSKMAGRKQEAGYSWLKNSIAQEDDPLTTNFRATGFNLIGRTTTPEDGMAATTESMGFGITRNPWNLDYSPGGSSGGSAAVVATGALPVCSASDGAGSIRIPAAWTGLIGLKTTRGRQPLPAGVNESIIPSASEGVVARSVRDTAGVYECLCQRAPGSGFMPYPNAGSLIAELAPSARRFKIAVSTANWSRTDSVPQVLKDAVQRTADWLADEGHQVDHVPESRICEFEQVYRSFKVANWVVPLGRWIPYMAEAAGVTMTTANTSPQTLGLIEAARDISLDDFLTAMEVSAATTRQWGLFWEQGYDLLLTPTLADTCPPVESDYALSSGLPFDAFFDHSLDLCRYTLPANDAGLPAISIPAGQDENGCPLGVQFYGPWAREADLIHIAAILESGHPDLFSQLAPLNVRAFG